MDHAPCSLDLGLRRHQSVHPNPAFCHPGLLIVCGTAIVIGTRYTVRAGSHVWKVFGPSPALSQRTWACQHGNPTRDVETKVNVSEEICDSGRSSDG